MITKIAFLITALVLGGCAAMVTPNPQEAAAADYGAYPSNYHEIVSAWIRTSMKDPYSVRDVQIGSPQKFWVTNPPLLGGKTRYGYMVALALNAKNSFGAYTGKQAYQLLIRDNRVIAHLWVNQPNREVTGPDWVFE